MIIFIFLFYGSTAILATSYSLFRFRDHTQTPLSIRLLCTSDRPATETSTWQHTTLTRDKHPCSLRDPNPQSQQANGHRPTPQTAQPPGSDTLF